MVKDIESSSDELKGYTNKLMIVTAHPTISRDKKSMSASGGDDFGISNQESIRTLLIVARQLYKRRRHSNKKIAQSAVVARPIRQWNPMAILVI